MVQITRLSPGGYSAMQTTIGDKTPANYPAIGLLVEEFDIWQEDYAGSSVSVYYAGTTSLMPIYSDPFLTDRITNPQILSTRTDANGNRYGKFATHVYTPFAYELDINNSQQTGRRFVPLYTLAGATADNALATRTGGSVARILADRFADVINLSDFGVIGSSPTTNTTTLENAIAAAVDAGGGVVNIPAGTIVFNTLSLPANVFLRGQGKGVTILQSQVADEVITYTGDFTGLLDLTLDGVSVLNGSVGVFGRAIERVLHINVEIKRFQTNVYWQGGKNHYYLNFDSTSGQVCFRARGDSDAASSTLGDVFSGLNWLGGDCGISTGTGLELYVVDRDVVNNTFRGVRFENNVGAGGAVSVYGAGRTVFDQCIWADNITNLDVNDNPSTALSSDTRLVSGVHVQGGSMTDGSVKLNGWCDDFHFSDILLDTVEFSLNTPINAIMLADAKQISCTVIGEVTKFLVNESRNLGTVRVTTTDGAATTVYRKRLEPNKLALLDVYAIGERVDGATYGVWHVNRAARGAVATLGYDNQTANFTAGKTILGATSGATAIINSDSDSGTTGTLSLGVVNGVFLDNEIIAETDGTGSAQANGILVEGSAGLIGTLSTLHSGGSNAGAVPASWAVTLAVVGQEVLVQVTADAAMKVQWDVKVNVTYRE